jgi:peptidoglycan/xylan/chitin deacetylase (PgdA/CDA1 family)
VGAWRSGRDSVLGKAASRACRGDNDGVRGKHLIVAFVAAGFVVASATSARSTPTGRVALTRLAGTVVTTSTTATPAPQPPPAPTTTTTSTTVPTIGTVALTFDDGPSVEFTPQVLDILLRYNVKATFFLVGSEAEANPDLVRRILRDGHAIGNHTWDHVALPTLDETGFVQQVDRTQALLERIAGRRLPCVRPPFGKIDDKSRAAMRARGLRVERWTADSGDWKRPGAAAIVANLLAGAEPHAVMLLHDGGPDMSKTVASLPAVIEGIHARGLAIAPIC